MHRSGLKVFESPPIEESYDYAEQVRRQIERCLEATAIQDTDIREGTYAACVLGLELLVPLDDRDKKFNDDLAKCSCEKEEWVYKKFGGVNMGTPDEPVCGSPWLVKTPEIDWNKYFTVLFNKFVELKVTVRRGSYAS